MQGAEQTSLLSFPANSTGISCSNINSTQKLIETRCESKQDDDLHKMGHAPPVPTLISLSQNPGSAPGGVGGGEWGGVGVGVGGGGRNIYFVLEITSPPISNNCLERSHLQHIA